MVASQIARRYCCKEVVEVPGCIEVFVGGKRLLLITNNGHLKSMILVLFCVWEDAGIWAYWSYSFDMHVRYLGPVSWFIFHLESSLVHLGEGCFVAHGFMVATFFVYWNDRWHSFSILPPFSHKFNQCLGGSSRLILSHSARKAHF